MSRFVALFDASALYSVSVTGLALEVAKHGVYQPKWSADIHEEWQRNVCANNCGAEAKAKARAEQMDRAFPDALVREDYRSLVDSLELPDKNDRHVLAAAIVSRSDVIVTFNLKDFPQDILDKYGIEAQHPDVFLLHQMTLAPSVFVASTKVVLQRFQKPPMSVADFLERLRKAGLVMLADALVEHSTSLC